MKRFLPIVLLSLTPLWALNIQGRLLDSKGAPIANGSVVLQSEGRTASSDQDGYFQITDGSSHVMRLGLQFKTRGKLDQFSVVNMRGRSVRQPLTKNLFASSVLIAYDPKCRETSAVFLNGLTTPTLKDESLQTYPHVFSKKLDAVPDKITITKSGYFQKKCIVENIESNMGDIILFGQHNGSTYLTFLLAGQSNMDGRGETDSLTTQEGIIPANVSFYRKNNQYTNIKERTQFGPELSFAQEMGASFPNEKIMLVKHASGGTSILAWSPTWTTEKAAITENEDKGPLYDELFSYVTKHSEKKSVEYCGLLFAQGGRDTKYEAAALAYKTNFEEFLDSVRSDLSSPCLQIVFMKTKADTSFSPHAQHVRDAQIAVAQEDPYSHICDPTGLQTKKDGIHFDHVGQIGLGKMYADKYRDLILGDARD